LALCGVVILLQRAPRALAAYGRAPTPSSASPRADSAQETQSFVVRDTVEYDVPVPPANVTPAGYWALFEALAPTDTFTIHMHPVVNHHLILGRDSVKIIVDSMARAWLAALYRDGEPSDRQRLNVAALQIQVDRDAQAQQSIAAFLKGPHVTSRDTVTAWRTAVELFTRTLHNAKPRAERMALGRTYLARLEAMPVTTAGGDLFVARLVMMGAFIRAGLTDSAIATGLRAYAALAQHPDFEVRSSATAGSGPNLLDLTQVMVGRPNGLARVDSLLKTLHQNFIVPPALAARDTALIRYGHMQEAGFAEWEGRIRLIGRPAPPLIATHWFNQPRPSKTSSAAPNAREFPLDDGTIHIIGFGWMGCAACMSAMAKMQNDQRLLPKGVSFMYYEWTFGTWGGGFVEPDEEAEHIRHYWLERKHYTFPITVWAGPKDSTAGGGFLPRDSPTRAALDVTQGPTFFIIDGHGIIRHRQAGYTNYQMDMEALVEKLLREETHDAAPSSASR